MARIRVEDSESIRACDSCLEESETTLERGKTLLETENLEIVTALREIAAGKVRRGSLHVKIGSRRAAEKALVAPPK